MTTHALSLALGGGASNSLPISFTWVSQMADMGCKICNQSTNGLGCQGDAYGVLWHQIPIEHLI